MSRPGLTAEQARLLTFLSTRCRPGEPSPSFDEMREALGLRSKSGIHRLVLALEKRGYIRRLPSHARSIEVVEPVGLASITIGLDGGVSVRWSSSVRSPSDRALIAIALQHWAAGLSRPEVRSAA